MPKPSTKHKKYQYKYLLEKIEHRSTSDDYNHLNLEYNDNLGSGLSSETYESESTYQEKKEKRTKDLSNWLDKINKKYNYA